MAPVIAFLHVLRVELQPFRHTPGTVAQQQSDIHEQFLLSLELVAILYIAVLNHIEEISLTTVC
jgi:hypothetical protein